MATNNLKRRFLKGAKTQVALAALGTLLASLIASAFLVEQRAVEDRLSFGATTATCIRGSCSPSRFLLD